jgi:probable F420-dependent oxidoreductase
MKVGVSFPQNGVGQDVAFLREFAQTADDLGYDYLFSGDHVLGENPDSFRGRPGPYTVDYIYHEPLILFSYLASITGSLRFFTGVLILPQRQTALVAKQAAECDFLSGGRLELGVGVGWNRLEYQALNEDFSTRGARVQEQFEVLRALWINETVTYHGRWHQIDGCGLNPRPIQRPIPLWIGGSSDVVLERAGRLSDGWIAATDPGVVASPENLRAPWQRVKDYAADAGRDPADLGLQVGVNASLPSDEARLRLDAWRELGATHVSVGTRELPNEPQAHIDAIRRFRENVLPE